MANGVEKVGNKGVFGKNIGDYRRIFNQNIGKNRRNLDQKVEKYGIFHNF